MKISKIFNKIQSNVAQRKINKQDALIDKYIKIHDVDTYGDSFAQMYDARKILANFAKEKGVSIDIYDGQKVFEDTIYVNPQLKESLVDQLHVIVTNLVNGKSKSKIVSARTDMSYPKVAEKQVLMPIPQDGLEIGRSARSTTEDSFLRNLYRNIEELTKEVTARNRI